MVPETRIGLLVGLIFIVMFALVLGELTGASKSGAVDIALRPPEVSIEPVELTAAILAAGKTARHPSVVGVIESGRLAESARSSQAPSPTPTPSSAAGPRVLAAAEVKPDSPKKPIRKGVLKPNRQNR